MCVQVFNEIGEEEANMPPWQRERLPLVYLDDALAVVPNVGVNCQMQAMQQSAKPVAGESSAQTGGSSAASSGPAAEAATDIDAANHAQGKAAPVQELNAIGLLWGLIKRFFAGLFR